MDICANCAAQFKRRADGKGYIRYSVENPLPVTGKSARDELSRMTGSSLTPVSKKSRGQFLCPSCWSKLSEATKYQQSLSEFFGATTASSYVASKRLFEKDDASPGPSFKRPRMTSTPLKRKGKTTRAIFGKGEKPSKWDTIITAIRARQYKRAINGLYNASAASKRSFASVVSQFVRREVNEVLKKDNISPLCKDVSISSLAEFSWDDAINDISDSAPLLFNSLRAAMTKKKNENSLLRGSSVNLKPRLGMLFALLLYAKSPRIANFIPTLLSIQFWRGRLKRDTVSQLARMGLCAGYEATLSTIDKIRSNFDSAARQLKADMEEVLKSEMSVLETDSDADPDLSLDLSVTAPNMEEEIANYSDLEDTFLYSEGEFQGDESNGELDRETDEEELFEEKEQEEDEAMELEEEEIEEGEHLEEMGDERETEMGGVEEEEVEEIVDVEEMEAGIPKEAENLPNKSPPGFTMCWDNVGKKVVTRRPSETVKNRYLNMALGYAAVNRVSSVHLNWKPEVIVDAADIPTGNFLPDESDVQALRDRMTVIAGRIITRHLQWFSDHFSDCAVPHILHDHSLESVRKSILLNLGVFNEDPSSTQGAIGIYERLQSYVPVVRQEPYPIIVYGDGLSCERGNDAHRARVNGLNPLERLEGLQPAVQEFHKEMLLLQDFYDEFFSAASASDRGTLSQIKNMFNYRQVKSDVSDNFTHSWELMCLMVEAFLCLLVMTSFEIADCKSRPANAPADIENASSDDKTAYFEEICKSVVNKVWQNLNTNRLLTEEDQEPPVVCCGEELDEDLIGCACKSSCPFGEYFHYTCASLDPGNLPETFYCSDECRRRVVQPYRYCNCKEDLGSDEAMIGCSADAYCTKFEWYHMRCVGIDENKPPKGQWFCCDACKKIKGKGKIKKGKTQDDKEDFVMNYSMGALWRGLNLMCRRDAVREADGSAMISFWKFDHVHFFAHKHPKYLILSHRLIASLNGWLPERQRFDLMHNRTVNYGGGMGRNLPMDFMNEILNRLFKDLLEAAKGRYTDTTVQRCSQLVGPFGETLDHFFDSNIVENEVYRHRRRAQNRDTNVTRLIDILEDEKLFTERLGRKHMAFPGFQLSVNPKQAGKFAAKMKQLSKRLDKQRRAVLHNQ